MNKTVLLSGSILALSLLIVGGLSFASAHGGFSGGFGGTFNSEEKLAAKAEMIGISSEDLQARLEGGESFRDILEAEGISKEDLKNSFKERMLERMAERVASGDLTQEEVDAKIERLENKDGKFRGFGKRGFHRFEKSDSE